MFIILNLLTLTTSLPKASAVVMMFMNILVSVSCLGISGVHGFHHSFTAKLNFSGSYSLHVVEIQPGFEVSKVNFDSRILSSTLANCFNIDMV